MLALFIVPISSWRLGLHNTPKSEPHYENYTSPIKYPKDDDVYTNKAYTDLAIDWAKFSIISLIAFKRYLTALKQYLTAIKQWHKNVNQRTEGKNYTLQEVSI